LCEGLMPKKKRHETQAEQSERFRRDARKLIEAGELNPTEAEAAVDRLVRKARDNRAGAK
jgi:polyhydroxyalkanoate synthesis regulator phasin